ncbi:MAG: nucleotidyltransferase domain-containing protein [Candidatus Aenigmarchaeota archaeon]|nr:nucleotidyltransferase domain-containing protein [Candidatus Aenigmarchaeota archaeon]
MGKKESVIKSLKDFKKSLSKDFPVKRMLLFGSYASGKPRKDSDIDLIIVSSKFKRLNFIKRGAKMYGYWKIRFPVDFLCYTPKEFNKLKKRPTIVKEAIDNGIEIN